MILLSLITLFLVVLTVLLMGLNPQPRLLSLKIQSRPSKRQGTP